MEKTVKLKTMIVGIIIFITLVILIITIAFNLEYCYTEPIKYKSFEQTDNSMWDYETKTIQNGENGERKICKKRITNKETSSFITKEPKEEIKARGINHYDSIQALKGLREDLRKNDYNY